KECTAHTSVHENTSLFTTLVGDQEGCVVELQQRLLGAELAFGRANGHRRLAAPGRKRPDTLSPRKSQCAVNSDMKTALTELCPPHRHTARPAHQPYIPIGVASILTYSSADAFCLAALH